MSQVCEALKIFPANLREDISYNIHLETMVSVLSLNTLIFFIIYCLVCSLPFVQKLMLKT